MLTGADDPMIQSPQVDAFKDEMQKASTDFQVVVYPGAGHGFTNSKNDGSIAPGLRYQAEADQQSWAAMRAFFEQVFAR